MAELTTKIDYMEKDIHVGKKLSEDMSVLSGSVYNISSNFELLQKSLQDLLKSQKHQGERIGKLENSFTAFKVQERIIWTILGAALTVLTGVVISNYVLG